MFYKASRQITVHTQRDRVMGRATEGSGAVFQYEALAPFQTFLSFVLCSDPDTADTVKRLLQEKDLLLGGSRSAGYGLTEVRNVQRVEDGWAEAPDQEADAVSPDDDFRLVLLSDVILRDDQGQHSGFLAPETLGAYLGVPLRLVRESTFARSGVVGGFNRKWGLPLPQTPVARAGSVYAFRAQADIPADRLQRLLDEGIGERRGEGFGRVALHWNQAAKVKGEKPDRKRFVPVTLDESNASATLARRMATRMLRRRLDAQLTGQINQLRIQGEIGNSQLSNVRTLVRSAWLNGETEPIIKHLNEMKETARKQFESARVGGAPLDRWILGLLQSSPKEVWASLYHTGFDEKKLPAVGGVRAEWDEKLAREYALRLIDGLLGRRMLEKRRAEK